MKRDFQFQFLRGAGLKPHHYLLDLGCGTLRGGIPLIDYLQTGHYFGTEVRPEVLVEGRKELKEERLEYKSPVLMVTPNPPNLSLGRVFDYIWSFSVLIHMDDDILDSTLGFVSRHLGERGIFYANVNIGTFGEGNWRGFPLVARTLDFYERVCERNGLILTEVGSLRDFGHISNVPLQDDQKMLKMELNN